MTEPTTKSAPQPQMDQSNSPAPGGGVSGGVSVPLSQVHIPVPKRPTMTPAQFQAAIHHNTNTNNTSISHSSSSSSASNLQVTRSPFATRASPTISPTVSSGGLPPLTPSQRINTNSAAGSGAGTGTGTQQSHMVESNTPSSPFVMASPSMSRTSASTNMLQQLEDTVGDTDLPVDEEFEGLPPSALGLTRSNSTHQMATRVKKDVTVPLLAAQILPANVYVQQRIGSILSRSMILKADQFPSENLSAGLDLHIIGAPNFQQVRPYAIYSTGQPSVSGIRTVLNLLHLKNTPRRRVQWINLREEPVVYLNNRPFVLRELEQPFRNMSDFAGIDTDRLQSIESRLKIDILTEGEKEWGNILVHDEVELGEIRACWTSVHESNVKTGEEIFTQLTKEGYNVSYLRIPVTAESVFEAKQIDALIRCFIESQRLAGKQSQSSMITKPTSGMGLYSQLSTNGLQDGLETFFVINDQMGRGRSSIGCICVYLLMKHVMPDTNNKNGRDSVTKPLSLDHGLGHEHEPDGLAAYRRGDFDIMLKLQRMLKDGKSCKHEVDIAIDTCGRVHHLRDQIVESFIKSEHARADDQQKVFSAATASYLKRYFYLVCFQSFLNSRPNNQPFETVLEAGQTFTDWWTAHPELQKLMATLVEDEALLDIVHPAETTTPPLGTGETSGAVAPHTATDDRVIPYSDAPDTKDFCNLLDRFVFSRSLPVLSKRTIIKSEFFHFSTRHQRVLFEHGLPNFRYYENLPLAATAQPNIKGIKNILHLIHDISRRRDRRIEAEAEAESGILSSGGADASAGIVSDFDDNLREVVQRHAHADSRDITTVGRVGSTAAQLLGHYSASALNLSVGRSTSDFNNDEVESIRYRPSHSQDDFILGSRPPLAHSASVPSYTYADASRVLWINLREEPVLFINSEPYLIRDYHHPFRVLTEFNTGMTQERTEQVEEGFKMDVLHELHDSEATLAKLHTTIDDNHRPDVARIVVHEETVSGQIRPRYETVRQPLDEHVLTTVEVYDSLRRQGYNLEYYRVPLHVEEVPGLKSFDRLFELLNSHQLVDEKINVVFSCQKGGRRSTMGMVVCVLMLMHQRSVHYSIRGEKDPITPAATATEKLAALNLSLNQLGPDGTATELHSVAGAGQDDNANIHGHTVSISAHPVHTHTRVPSLPTTTAENAPTSAALALTSNLIAPNLTTVTSSAGGTSATMTVGNQAITGPLSALPSATVTPVLSPLPAPMQTPLPSLKKSQSSVSIRIEEIDRHDTRARYGRGEYKGILGLIRILKEGGRVKEEVDVAIDAVGGIVNIRDSIAQAKSRADGERQREKGLQNKALKYLESYAYLILFNSYLRERRDTEEEAAQIQQQTEMKEKEAADITADEKKVQFADDGTETPPDFTPASSLTRRSSGTFSFPSFSLWISSRPELRNQLENIHRDAEDALKLNSLSITDDQYASVYESRQGNVLVNGTILKSDYFKGCVNKNIEQFIDGAINFRPIDRFPCAGTGIPTGAGIRGILDFFTTPPEELKRKGLGAYAPAYQSTMILWFNLREEPLLYVNEMPFVLRDGDDPYVNIEHTGINTRRLEAMERQLRRDVLAESERMRYLHSFGHHASSSPEPMTTTLTSSTGSGTEITSDRFLAGDENENGNLIAVWMENISATSIQTPQMQFLRCFEEVALSKKSATGATFKASYFRTPITDEQAPSPSTLDDIIAALETARDSPTPTLIFNCQMGRGRTTTGLIIACLWCIHRGKVPDYENWLNQDTKKKVTNVLAAPTSTATSKSILNSTTSPISPTTSTSSTYMEPSNITGDDEQSVKQQREEEFANGRRHGWYKCIQSLVRMLPDGPQIKRIVDRVIDHCGTMQNLRLATYETQILALTCLPRKKPFFVRRGTNYLIRYFFLILINAYMTSEVAYNFSRVTFAGWLAARPEYQNILSKLEYPEEFKMVESKPITRRTGSLQAPIQLSPNVVERNLKETTAH